MSSFEEENMDTEHILTYRIDLRFHEYKLVTKFDANDTVTEKQQNKNLVVSLLKLILTKKTLIFLELSMKYLDTLNNQLKRL